MTRKSCKHNMRHMKPMESFFDLIMSHRQCIPHSLSLSLTGDHASDHRIQSRNSTSEPMVRINHK